MNDLSNRAIAQSCVYATRGAVGPNEAGFSEWPTDKTGTANRFDRIWRPVAGRIRGWGVGLSHRKHASPTQALSTRHEQLIDHDYLELFRERHVCQFKSNCALLILALVSGFSTTRVALGETITWDHKADGSGPYMCCVQVGIPPQPRCTQIPAWPDNTFWTQAESSCAGEGFPYQPSNWDTPHYPSTQEHDVIIDSLPHVTVNEYVSVGSIHVGSAGGIELSAQLSVPSGQLINDGLIYGVGRLSGIQELVNNGNLRTHGWPAGSLQIYNTTIVNNGVISATAGNHILLGNGVLLNGGELFTLGPSTIMVPSGHAPSVTGNVTNNGILHINGRNAVLQILDQATFSGGGRISFSSGYIVGDSTSSTNTLTNEMEHSITGSGKIHGDLQIMNNGTIDADVPGYLEIILGSDNVLTNNHILRASNGGSLHLYNTTVVNNNIIKALTGSQVQLGAGAKIIGGQFQSEGNGVVIVPSSFYGGPSLSGVIDNEATISISGPSGTLGICGDVTLTGYGEIRFSSGYIADDPDCEAGRLTNASHHTILGSGKIHGYEFRNRANLIAESGQGLVINSEYFDTAGLVRVDTAGSLQRSGDYFQVGGKTVVNGQMVVTGDYIQTAGETIVNGFLAVQGRLLIQGGSLTGTGSINGHPVSDGTYEVAPFGDMEIEGSFSQSTEGTTVLDVRGAVPGDGYGTLVVRGGLFLDGRLRFIFPSAFVPAVGESFTFIEAASVSGEFNSVLGPGAYELSYSGNSVAATVVARPGDANADGTVDLVDYATFVECADGPTSEAPDVGWDEFDFDGDGDVDLADFRQFQTLVGSAS